MTDARHPRRFTNLSCRLSSAKVFENEAGEIDVDPTLRCENGDQSFSVKRLRRGMDEADDSFEVSYAGVDDSFEPIQARLLVGGLCISCTTSTGTRYAIGINFGTPKDRKLTNIGIGRGGESLIFMSGPVELESFDFLIRVRHSGDGLVDIGFDSKEIGLQKSHAFSIKDYVPGVMGIFAKTDSGRANNDPFKGITIDSIELVAD